MRKFSVLSGAIGIFGGTFDPVHLGHVHLAETVLQELGLAQVRFIPCFKQAHGKAIYATPKERLDMLNLALADKPKFLVDDREIKRQGISYMFDTLESLHKELPILNANRFSGIPPVDPSSLGITRGGKEQATGVYKGVHDCCERRSQQSGKTKCEGYTPLCLLMGIDAFAKFNTWYRWQEIMDLAHLVVVDRPNSGAVDISVEMQKLKREGGIYQSQTGFQGWHQIYPSSLGFTRGGKESGEGVYSAYMTDPIDDANKAENQNAKGIQDKESLHANLAGSIYYLKIKPLPIAAHEIRALIKAGKNAEHLVPKEVWQYISSNNLYRF